MTTYNRHPSAKPYRSPYDILIKRPAVPGLCTPGHPTVAAALRAATALTPSNAPLLFDFLATANVLAWWNSILFDADVAPQRRAAIVEASNDLASLPPKLLLDGPVFGPADALGSYADIDRHCRGLVSRPARQMGPVYRLDDAMPKMWRLLGFDWKTHIADLDQLRTARPDVFTALIEDRASCVLAQIRAVEAGEPSHDLVRIAFRHWLLNRAFRLQCGVAYIASLAQAATPAPCRSISGVGNTTVVAARAWVESFATSAHAHAQEYSTWGKGPTFLKGRRSLPVEFLRTALEEHWDQEVPMHDKVKYDVALGIYGQTIAGRIRGISRMVESVDQCAADRHRWLYARARLPRQKLGRRTLFSNWNYRLSPAALLLLLTRRFFDAAAICEAVNVDPGIAYDKAVQNALRTTCSNNEIEAVAVELAEELMGDWAPALENTDAPFKLAAAYRSDTEANPRSAAARYFARIDPLAPFFLPPERHRTSASAQ